MSVELSIFAKFSVIFVIQIFFHSSFSIVSQAFISPEIIISNRESVVPILSIQFFFQSSSLISSHIEMSLESIALHITSSGSISTFISGVSI